MIEPSAAESVKRIRTTAPRRSQVGVSVYSGLLVATCAGVVLTSVPSGDTLIQGLLWMPLVAIAQMTRITASPHTDRSLASIVIVAAALLLPVQAVVLFTFVGLLSPQEVHRHASLVMALFNRAQFALSGAAAALAAAPVIGAGDAVWRLILGVMVGSVAFALANNMFLVVALVVRRGVTWRLAIEDVSNPFPRFVQNAVVSATLSLLLALMVRDVGAWSVALLVAPMWLSHSAQQSARRAQDRAEELAVRVRQLEMLNMLSNRLLSVRSADEIPQVASTALETALEATGVTLDLQGERGTSPETVVPVAGAEPAVIAVPTRIDDDDRAMVEASAALVSLTLTRLAVESELAETERARTALTGRILEEATHERSRIAMDVHDNVLPLFAAAQMKIDTVEATLERDPSRAAGLIDGAMQAVTDGISELRDTLEALRRSTLVPGTLREGVGKVLAEFQSRTGVRTTLAASDPMPQLPFAVELLAFETIRGGLANVEKHARATSLHVEFEADEGRLVVLMRDDGQGFDPMTVGQRSHGLALMRQRAELARGQFDIESTIGVGTMIRLEVPTW